MKSTNNTIFKLALAEQYLSFLISTMTEGGRLPSIKAIAEELNLSVGIIQKALAKLESIDAVFLEKKGHCGSFLKNKDLTKLYVINQRTPLFCTLPLPYTLRYEGLASSIYHLTHQFTPCYFIHTRGASLRLELVGSGKSDMAIVSRFAFETMKCSELEIAYSYGVHSYLNRHIIVLRPQENLNQVQTIGFDSKSHDQQFLIEKVFSDPKLIFKDINYHTLISKLINKEIDATILNEDEDRVNAFQKITIDPTGYHMSLTEAVLVVRKDNKKIKKMIASLWKTSIINEFIKKIISGQESPSY